MCQPCVTRVSIADTVTIGQTTRIPAAADKMTTEVLLRGATIFDGTGAPRCRGDIAIAGGRIEAVGTTDAAGAAKVIDLDGLAVAPGFIDVHTHDDRLLLADPSMAPKVSQGVTTVVAGNCGISLAPMPGGCKGAVTPPLDLLDDSGAWFRFPRFRDYVEEVRAQRAATNCALLVGHTTLRVATMDRVDRAATPSEILRMRDMVSEAMSAGAVGASTGLYYEPAAAAPSEEVVDVCVPLKEFGGIYCTHMRNEADRVLESLHESFQSAREMGVPLVISHHKVNGLPNHGRSPQTLALIERQMRVQPIGLDCYPYSASSTVLSADRAAAASRTVVTWSKPHPEYAGNDLTEIAKVLRLGQDEAVARLLPAGAIYFSMDEADVRRILAFAPTMIGSEDRKSVV